MHLPTDRIAHTTTFVTPVVEHWLKREIAQWVRPMKDRTDDPSHHERTLLPQSAIDRDNTIQYTTHHSLNEIFRSLLTGNEKHDGERRHVRSPPSPEYQQDDKGENAAHAHASREADGNYKEAARRRQLERLFFKVKFR